MILDIVSIIKNYNNIFWYNRFIYINILHTYIVSSVITK